MKRRTPKFGSSLAKWFKREWYALETRRVGVAIDLYCERRRDWSFAAAEVDGEGEKDSVSGEEVCGRYGDEEEGVRGPSSKGGLHDESIRDVITVTVTLTR